MHNFGSIGASGRLLCDEKFGLPYAFTNIVTKILYERSNMMYGIVKVEETSAAA